MYDAVALLCYRIIFSFNECESWKLQFDINLHVHLFGRALNEREQFTINNGIECKLRHNKMLDAKALFEETLMEDNIDLEFP